LQTQPAHASWDSKAHLQSILKFIRSYYSWGTDGHVLLPAGLLGINLGKNKASNDAATDYSIGGASVGIAHVMSTHVPFWFCHDPKTMLWFTQHKQTQHKHTAQGHSTGLHMLDRSAVALRACKPWYLM
jgi:hypothetical protein